MKKYLASGFLVFSLILFLFLLFKNNSFQKQQKIEVDDVKESFNLIVVEEEEANPEDLAYRIGYEQGKKALYNQMAITGDLSQEQMIALSSELGLSNTLEMQYTSQKEEIVSSYNEAEARGYVDGYHKATESLNCPRCIY